MIYCKSCNKEISALENNIYRGYCENCYEILREKKTKCDNHTHANNVIATIIKTISIILFIIVIARFVFSIASSFEIEMESIIISIIIMIGTCIGSVFIYGFGEIIQLLEDIKNK